MTTEEQLADLKDRIERLTARYEGDLRGLVVRYENVAATLRYLLKGESNE